jgi:predicted porin
LSGGKFNRGQAIWCAVSIVMFMPFSTMAAEKISLRAGGELVQYFGYVHNDDTGTGDFTGFDVKADGELEIAGETTLDNGIGLGVEVVLKTETSDDEQIDGSYLWAEGAFGRVELGQNDNVAKLMHIIAPEVGFQINKADIADWVINPSGGDSNSAFETTYLYLGSEKATQLSWISPRVAGLRIGVSYIPEFEPDNNAQPAGDLYGDGIAIAANYEQELGESAKLNLSAGYLAAARPDTVSNGVSAEGFNLGFNLEIDGFVIGASYANTDGLGSSGADTAASLEGEGYDVGISYAFEPLVVSLSYYHGAVEDQAAVAGDSSHDTVMLSLKAELRPGAGVLLSLFHTRYEADSGVENNGTALVGGVVLEF